MEKQRGWSPAGEAFVDAPIEVAAQDAISQCEERLHVRDLNADAQRRSAAAEAAGGGMPQLHIRQASAQGGLQDVPLVTMGLNGPRLPWTEPVPGRRCIQSS